MRLSHIALAATLLAGVAAPAWSHQVWLERDGDSARIYFGEPGENLRERTGGLLDRIATPRVFTTAPDQAAKTERRPDHIEAAVPAGPGDVWMVEDGLPPAGRAGAEKGKTIFLAREGRQSTAAKLELELVPTTPGGATFTLIYKGETLPRTEIVLVGPPRWEKRVRTDEAGRVTLETPWSGRYVAEAIHLDRTPGGTGEGAYAQRRLVSTLSFTVTAGLPWAEGSR